MCNKIQAIWYIDYRWTMVCKSRIVTLSGRYNDIFVCFFSSRLNLALGLKSERHMAHLFQFDFSRKFLILTLEIGDFVSRFHG